MTFSSAGFARDVIIVLGGIILTVALLVALFAVACLVGKSMCASETDAERAYEDAEQRAWLTSPVDADAEQAAALGEQR